jgi:hypothetical protein
MRFLERLLASVGALAVLVVSIGIWMAVSDRQPMWPLPDIYLVEIVALSIIAMLAAFRGSSFDGAAMWAVVGVLLAFVALGALSIGPLYLPSALAVALAAILLDRRQRRSILADLAICLAAGAVQAGLMFAVIQSL